jgi:hypothetical protein
MRAFTAIPSVYFTYPKLSKWGRYSWSMLFFSREAPEAPIPILLANNTQKKKLTHVISLFVRLHAFY